MWFKKLFSFDIVLFCYFLVAFVLYSFPSPNFSTDFPRDLSLIKIWPPHELVKPFFERLLGKMYKAFYDWRWVTETVETCLNVKSWNTNSMKVGKKNIIDWFCSTYILFLQNRWPFVCKENQSNNSNVDYMRDKLTKFIQNLYKNVNTSTFGHCHKQRFCQFNIVCK